VFTSFDKQPEDLLTDLAVKDLASQYRYAFADGGVLLKLTLDAAGVTTTRVTLA